MGGVFWRGGSQEVTKHITIVRLKMEDICILCNAIKVFYQKNDQDRKMKVFWPFQAPNGINVIM
jgi:hypothetical protein